MTDDPFPAANIGFHQGTPVVPRRFLPTHAAMFGNRSQMPVTRSGRILGRLARHATRTRRHNDRRIGMAGSDLVVDAALVVCTIAGQRSDGIINLVEQGTDLRAVIDIIGGQRRRDDPAGVGIDTDVQSAPRPAPARTVLLDQPFAGARQLQPVLSTNRCTGSALDGGPATASVSARRLSVEWSGIARSRPSRRMTEPISPSVCRRARRNTARSVSAVVIARAE